MIKAEELYTIWAGYGRAILAAQGIERRIIMLVAQCQNLIEPSEGKNFEEKFQCLERKPLAQAIKIGKKNGAISPELFEALEHYRQLRNHLVHDISDSITLRLFTQSEAEEVIKEILSIATYFEGFSEVIMQDVFSLYELNGGSKEDVFQKALQLIATVSKLDRLERPSQSYIFKN